MQHKKKTKKLVLEKSSFLKKQKFITYKLGNDFLY